MAMWRKMRSFPSNCFKRYVHCGFDRISRSTLNGFRTLACCYGRSTNQLFYLCFEGYLTLANDFSAGKGSSMNFKESVNQDHQEFPGLQAFSVRVMEWVSLYCWWKLMIFSTRFPVLQDHLRSAYWKLSNLKFDGVSLFWILLQLGSVYICSSTSRSIDHSQHWLKEELQVTMYYIYIYT